MCVTYTYLARMNVCACRHTHTYLKRVCIHRLTIRNRHSDGAALEAGPANAQGGVVGVVGEGSGEDSHSTTLLVVAEGPEVNDSDVSKGGEGGGGGVIACVPAQGLFSKGLHFHRNGTVEVAGVCP